MNETNQEVEAAQRAFRNKCGELAIASVEIERLRKENNDLQKKLQEERARTQRAQAQYFQLSEKIESAPEVENLIKVVGALSSAAQGMPSGPLRSMREENIACISNTLTDSVTGTKAE